MSFSARELPKEVLEKINQHLIANGIYPLTGMEITDFREPCSKTAQLDIYCAPSHPGHTGEKCHHKVVAQCEIPYYGHLNLTFAYLTTWVTTHADGHLEMSRYVDISPNLRLQILQR